MSNQTRSTYQGQLDTSSYFEDNTSELITEAKLRGNLTNLSDSAVFKKDDAYLRVEDVTTGTEPAYVVTLTNEYPAAYNARMPILFKAHATNTGAATLNVNSLGAINIVRPDGAATQAGDIQQDQLYLVNYITADTEFRIVPGFGGGTAFTLSTGGTDNAILRADGTGGSTSQNSDLTISDVATGTVTISSSNTINIAPTGTGEIHITPGASATQAIEIFKPSGGLGAKMESSGAWDFQSNNLGSIGTLSTSGDLTVGGTGPLQRVHIKTSNGNNAAVAGNFANNYYGLVVESEDANLALISKDEGGHGSGIDLMEVDSGVLADKWWIGRWSSGTVGSGDSRLEFTYGTNADYTTNERKFTVYTDDKAAFYNGTDDTYQLGIGTATLNSLELAFGAPGGIAQIGTDSDSQRISIGGGTTPSANNTAYINLNGNGYTGAEGELHLLAGNTGTSGSINFYTGAAAIRGSISFGGVWEFQSNDLTAIGDIATTGARVTIGYFTDITSTNAVNVDSDKRLKKNIKPIESATETISKINPIAYKWKDKDRGEGKHYGVIAQELKKVLPELVKEDETLSVSYGELIPILLKSIQELNDRVTKLESI